MVEKKQILALKQDDGSTRKDSVLLKRAGDLYRKLYAFTDKTGHNPAEDKREEVATDEPCVLPEEVAKAIKSMKSGKAPGGDGITTEILKEAGVEVEKLLAKL